ncbi:MAG: hypothetical protein ACE14S_10900 [Candidatus Bathyarchaeia archaeon]
MSLARHDAMVENAKKPEAASNVPNVQCTVSVKRSGHRAAAITQRFCELYVMLLNMDASLIRFYMQPGNLKKLVAEPDQPPEESSESDAKPI